MSVVEALSHPHALPHTSAAPTVRSPVRVPYRGGWVRVRGSNLGHSADQVVVVVEEEALPADCVRMQTPHRALSVQCARPPPHTAHTRTHRPAHLPRTSHPLLPARRFPLGTLARAGRKLPLVVQVAGQRAHAEFLYEVPDLPTPPPLPGRVWALQAAPDGLALARRRRQYRLRREAEEERCVEEGCPPPPVPPALTVPCRLLVCCCCAQCQGGEATAEG